MRPSLPLSALYALYLAATTRDPTFAVPGFVLILLAAVLTLRPREGDGR
jgi:hypothetical protein